MRGVAGLTSTIAGSGPKNYTVQTSTSASCSDGISGYTTVDIRTNASSSVATTSSFAATTARCIQIHVTASYGSLVQIAELALVKPSIDIDLVDMQPTAGGLVQVRLAQGGFNSIGVRVRNNSGSSQTVTVGASGLPTAVTSNSPVITVPPGESGLAQLTLTAGASASNGISPNPASSTITVTGTSAAPESVTILHTDNLALNDVGTPFPSASSNGEDPSWLYPAKLAIDGSVTGSSYWVSRPASLGPADPVCLVVDLGSSVNVGRVVVTPRTSPTRGPKDYLVQTSSTGGSDCTSTSGWTTRAMVTNASATAPTNSTWAQVGARFVRLRIAANQGSGPPYQSQVREFGVYPN